MGTGFICNGAVEPAAGLDVTNFVDMPRLALAHGEDYCHRSTDTWIHAIVIHSTKGLPGGGHDTPQDIRPGFGPAIGAGERVARFWSRDGRQAGAHLVVDFDGSVWQTTDLISSAAYGCPGWNKCGIQIEIYQGGSAEFYVSQLEAVVRLVDWLTRRFSIQRTIPHRYVGPIRRFTDHGPDDFVGVLGHRDAARNRGPGDPGSKIFYMLGDAGYQALNLDLSEDRDALRRVQRSLGMGDDADGIPGPKTVAALKAAGYAHGLLVRRPGDDPSPPVVA
jgi:hypothetical protein